ncbi:hypothetical protein CW304_30820 [Bacillus sp. UFRGS-B20]|nr:hypothetical protein CW304_30820 [Bacillus sp. UFRGS-B20]
MIALLMRQQVMLVIILPICLINEMKRIYIAPGDQYEELSHMKSRLCNDYGLKENVKKTRNASSF